MCETCNSLIVPKFTIYAKERLQDPTRTMVLRNRFVKEVNRRFASFYRAIYVALVKDDILALKPNPLLIQQRFDFPTNTQKMEAFMEWINQLVEQDLLSLGTMPQLGQARQAAWTDLYVSDSYKRGVQRARYEMRKAGMPVPSLEKTGGLSASMSTPFHLDRVGMAFLRTYEDLKGITNSMSSQISKVVSMGLIDGDGPALIARKLNATIMAGGGDLSMTDALGRFIPARRRAQTLARTEVIRSHHMGMMQEYKNWAVEGVFVQAEWSTANDDRVCPICASLEGTVYTLEEAENLIPRHLNCRCIMLPKVVEGKKTTAEAPIQSAGYSVEELEEMGFMVDNVGNLPDKEFRALTEKLLNGFDVKGVDKDMVSLLKEIHADSALSKSIKVYSGREPYFKINYITRNPLTEAKREHITRSFHLNPDRTITVMHDYLKFSKDAHDKGYAKQVLKRWFQEYEKMPNLSTVELQANLDVGGYAWARYGVHYRSEVDRYFVDTVLTGGTSAQKDIIMNVVKQYYAKYPDARTFPMNLIADLPFGKNMLLGTDWHGVLNFKDPVQIARIKQYINP